jgi:urea transport system permease protein
MPALHLLLPESSPFHVSTYVITLTGKIMCYAIVAVAMDLVWGYAGILSSAMACSSRSAATPSACI